MRERGLAGLGLLKLRVSTASGDVTGVIELSLVEPATVGKAFEFVEGGVEIEVSLTGCE